MNTYFKSDVHRYAFIERCAWKEFNDSYKIFDNYNKIVTPYDGNDSYDVFLYKIDNEGRMYNRIFLEIKVRNKNYNEWFFETKKYNAILNMCKKELYLKDDEYKILYLNFTEIGTLIWDTDIIYENDMKVSTQMMNTTTFKSRIDKTLKSKYDMPTDKAKHYKYIWDESHLEKHYKEYFYNEVEKKVKKVGLELFFDNL